MQIPGDLSVNFYYIYFSDEQVSEDKQSPSEK